MSKAKTKGKGNKKNADVVKAPKTAEEIEFAGYKGKTPDIDYEAAKKRAQEYDDKVIKPEVEQAKADIQAQFDEVIDTQAKWADFYDEDNYEFDVIYNMKKYKVQIRALQEGDDFSILDMDSGDVYADLNKPEQAIVEKVREGVRLTSDEERILAKINKQTDGAKLVFKNMNAVLTQHVVLPDFSKEEWERKIPFLLRMFIYQETLQRLGMDNRFQPKLFQTGGASGNGDSMEGDG
jgi:hypothetical protein